MKSKLREEKKKLTPPADCERCGNHYLVIWLTQGDQYNDFGDRHCPFCGLVSELFHIPANT